MADMPPKPPWMFDLSGTFLEFWGNAPAKAKYVALAVEADVMIIKVPKELRYYLRSQLHPGDRLRCIGRSQLDFKAGVIQLKAYQVLSLPATAAAAIPQTPSPAVKQPKRSKILICHKSGCQKRGGRQVAAALETLLHDHHLQDHVEIHYTGCQKRCAKAPNLTVMPGKHHYDRLTLTSLTDLIDAHFCPPASHQAPYHVDP